MKTNGLTRRRSARKANAMKEIKEDVVNRRPFAI
jgi:hypothetical protein